MWPPDLIRVTYEGLTVNLLDRINTRAAYDLEMIFVAC